MKIAYVSGVCVRHDAISNAVRDGIGWLREAGHDVRLFTYSCDHTDLPFTLVQKEADVAYHPHFLSSDLVVFHFGVFYPLFNLLPVAPIRAKRIVVFHNITPKQFLPPSAHELIDRSFAQMSNIAFADHVGCDSQTNQAVLHEAGIRVPSTVLLLAVPGKLQPPERKPSFDDQWTRIAFLGRLVKSKGPDDLLEAVTRVLQSNSRFRLRLHLVANLNFSDKSVITGVQSRIGAMLQRFGGRLEVNIHGDAPETEKQKILSDADMFVLPTYHEGFCVPILEALASGCRVVTYDNSNTPAVSGGLARLVPTGDIAELANSISDTVTSICSSSWRTGGGYLRYSEKTAAHVNNFRPEVVRQRYLELMECRIRSRPSDNG